MTHPLYLRWNTQDIVAAVEVLDNNEYRLPEAFDSKDVILDVGANIGVFAHACLARGCGEVICFEPEPTNFSMLIQNTEAWDDERVELHPCAVWHTAGPIMLTQRGPLMSAMHHTMGGGDLQVLAVTLEPFLRQPIRLLKLDCEGAEKPILDSVKSLDNVQEVVGEIHYQMAGLQEAPPTDEWLTKRLWELGFGRLTIAPSERAPKYIATFFAKR